MGKPKQPEPAPPAPTLSRARARGEEDAPPPPEPKGQIARTLMRVDVAEDLLASGIAPRRVEGMLAARFGLSRRGAARYVEAVLKRWEREGQQDRERKRDSIRQRAQRAYRVAMEREKGYVVMAGRDEEGGDVQEVEMVPDPDTRGAIAALELESRLDGLQQQPAQQGGAGGFEGDALGRMQAFLFGAQVANALQGQREAPALEATVTVVEKGDKT